MPRPTPTRRHCAVPFAVLAAVAIATPAVAAVPTTYLPENTMLVVSLNVKQLLQAPLVHADEKAFKEAMVSGAKALETFGVNPAKDVDRVVLAMGEDLKAATFLLLLHGQFDATKIDGRLRQLARERKNDVQVFEEGGATLFQGRLPRPAAPNPTIMLPEKFFLAVLDGATIAVGTDRAAVVDAFAKKSGRKSEIKPRVAELVGRMDPRETLSVVYSPPADSAAGGATAGLTAVTGGVTVADGVKSDVRIDVKDAEAARRIATDVTEGLTRVKELLPGLAAFQPGVGRKEQEMIKEMLDTIKVATRPDAVLITSTISKELIEKNARKDQ